MSNLKRINKITTFVTWFILMVIACILTVVALFLQTRPYIKEANFFIKLCVTQIIAMILWGFAIPAQRLGYLILTPFQLSLSSEVFTFISQLLADKFWLDKVTTNDDYIGGFLILLGMVVAKIKLFD